MVLILADNADLRGIDLSSLKEIRGGGYVNARNPELCYTGDLSLYLEDPSYQLLEIPPLRKASNECGEL